MGPALRSICIALTMSAALLASADAFAFSSDLMSDLLNLASLSFNQVLSIQSDTIHDQCFLFTTEENIYRYNETSQQSGLLLPAYEYSGGMLSDFLQNEQKITFLVTKHHIIYQLDLATNEVQVLTGSKQSAGSVDSTFNEARYNGPQSIAKYDNNRYIVVEIYSSKARLLTLSTETTTTISAEDWIHLPAPTRIIRDPNEYSSGTKWFVCSSSAIGRVELDDSLNALSSIIMAGSVSESGNTDGSLTQARFDQMSDMLFVSPDVVVIAETYIRIMNLTEGTIVTLQCGIQACSFSGAKALTSSGGRIMVGQSGSIKQLNISQWELYISPDSAAPTTVTATTPEVTTALTTIAPTTTIGADTTTTMMTPATTPTEATNNGTRSDLNSTILPGSRNTTKMGFYRCMRAGCSVNATYNVQGRTRIQCADSCLSDVLCIGFYYNRGDKGCSLQLSLVNDTESHKDCCLRDD